MDERYPWSKVASFDGDPGMEEVRCLGYFLSVFYDAKRTPLLKVMVPNIGRPPLPTPPVLPFEGPVPVSGDCDVWKF